MFQSAKESAQGLASTAAGHASTAASTAAGHASTAAGHASTAAGSASAGVASGASVASGAAYSSLAMAKEAYNDKGSLGESLAGVFKDRVDIVGLKDAGFGMAGEALRERKAQAKVALMDLSSPVRTRMLLAIREILKSQAVADPDMWNCASRRIQDGIELFWDDLTVYIETIESDSKDAISDRNRLDLKALTELGDKPMCFSPRWFRAFILYHYLPFDISIFAQVKDPVFWILTAFSCLTMYGIRVAFFSVLLLLMLTGCPADEYQLVQYILAFKGTQFISSGVITALVAAVKYYLCVHPGGSHTCDIDGPGVNVDVASSAIDYFGCCILCWIVFLLLPTANRSAGLKEIADDPEATEQNKKCCCSWHPGRGGRLKGLLGYDLLCFVASTGLVYLMAYGDANSAGDDMEVEVNKWEFKTAIFFGRIFYSLLAFPFLIYMIPGLNSILTHTTATGYNRQGLCVACMLHPLPVAEE